MTDLEELIGATLRRQADHIPPPGPILAKLQRPARRGRARIGLLLAATTAVVAVAIMVTVQQLTVTSTPPPPGGLSPTPSPEPTVAPKTGPTLAYTAGWLPDGFTEKHRMIGEHGMQVRSWSVGQINADRSDYGQKPEISLSMHTTAEPGWADAEEAIKNGQDRVLIQSHPGNFNFVYEGIQVRLVWMQAPNVFMNLSMVGISNTRQTALQIAGSVRADGISTVRSEIKFGALPSPLQEARFGVIGNSPSDASSDLLATMGQPSDATTPTVSVVLSRTAPTKAGTVPVTVRGRQGTYGAPIDQRDTESSNFTEATLAVRLEDGRWLTLSAPGIDDSNNEALPTPLTKEQLVAILDGIQFNPDPDYSWLGSR